MGPRFSNPSHDAKPGVRHAAPSLGAETAIDIAAPEDLPENTVHTYQGAEPDAAETLAPDSSPPTRLPEVTVSHAPRGEEPAPPVQGAAGPAYELKSLIAQGGMGEVWKALQVSLDRIVAVKRLSHTAGTKIGRTRRVTHDFRQEALISARLEHPNIVPVYDGAADRAGNPLIVMRLVGGMDWETAIRDDLGHMPRESFFAKHLGILIQVCQAVAYAHSRDIVHRDIKPAQVLLGEYGEVLLTDWGLAVYMGGEADHGTPSGQANHLRTPALATSPSGTPALMAPEQTHSRATNVGPWTDIFLLGGTLYFVLTGTYPFSAGTSRDAFDKACRCEVVPPRERAPHLDPPVELCRLAMEALRRDPAERVASAQAFVTRLQDYLSGAGRRAESETISSEARAELASGTRTYALFTHVIARCRAARDLWPDNHEAAVTEEEAHELYAPAALANGDLTLARLQADSLGDEAIRAGIIDAVTVKESALAHQRRQRRLAFASAFALLLALAVVVSGAYMVLRKSFENERAARESAVLAREDAEHLVGFMIGDFYDSLREAQRLELLEPVARRVLAYYDGLARTQEELTPGQLARVAHGYLIGSQIARNQGNLADAETRVDRAAEVLGQVSPGDIPPLDYHQTWQRIHATRGFIHKGRDQHDQALAMFREALEANGRCLEVDPGNPQLLEHRISLQADLGVVLARARGTSSEEIDGLAALILENYDELRRSFPDRTRATNVIADAGEAFAGYYVDASMAGKALATLAPFMERVGVVLDEHPGSRDATVALLTLNRQRFFALHMAGETDVAQELAEWSRSEAGRLAISNPLERGYVNQLQDWLELAALIPRIEGDWETVARELETAVRLAEQQVGWDPTNAEWRHDLAWAQSKLARAYRMLGRMDEARELVDSAIDQASRALADKPTDNLIAHSLASLAHEASFSAYFRDDFDEAMELADTAWDAARIEMETTTTSQPHTLLACKIADHRGRVLKALGRFDDAQEAYGDAVRIADEAMAHSPAFVGFYMGSTFGIIQTHDETGGYDRALVLIDRAAARVHEVGDALDESAATVSQDIRVGLVIYNVFRAYALARLDRLDEAYSELASNPAPEEALRQMQGGNLVPYLDYLRERDAAAYARAFGGEDNGG